MWTYLGHGGKEKRPCASSACRNEALYRLDADDVQSDYCTACKVLIDMGTRPTVSTPK